MESSKIQTIQNVCDLISKTSTARQKKFDKETKIKFAYQYWTENSEDITELYDYLAINHNSQNEKLALIINEFINSQQISPTRKFSNKLYNGDLQKILNTTAQVRQNGNWLSQYNLESEFHKTSLNAHPIRYSYLNKDNQTFTIDQQVAQSILGILIDNNIPTSKCLVTASFPYYANDDMDTYIKSFQKIR